MELTAEMVYKESMNTLAVQLADKTVEATTYRLLSDSLSEVIQTATNHLLNSELTPEQKLDNLELTLGLRGPGVPTQPPLD
jgi:hypothetical protein